MVTVENEYTRQQVIRMNGAIAHIGAPSFWLHCGNQKWLTEWHQYFGPICLNAKTEDPRDKQPSEKSMFWNVAVWWKNQGAKVIGGIGQWKYPPPRMMRYRKIGNANVIAHDDGPDVIQMQVGWVDDWNGID